MEFNIRRLNENDWDTLVSWWDEWPGWHAITQGVRTSLLTLTHLIKLCCL